MSNEPLNAQASPKKLKEGETARKTVAKIRSSNLYCQ